VFLITTLCFVQDVGRSLAEARRVLAAGGRLVTAILPRDREIGRRVTADSTDVFFRTARLLTVAELHEALARAGFRVEREAATLVDLASPEKVERAWDGSDRGSFVAVRSAVAPQEAGASTQC